MEFLSEGREWNPHGRAGSRQLNMTFPSPQAFLLLLGVARCFCCHCFPISHP